MKEKGERNKGKDEVNYDPDRLNRSVGRPRPTIGTSGAKGERRKLKGENEKGKSQMKSLKNYGVVIGIVLLVLMLVVFRSGGNNFRPDAEKHAIASFNGANLLTVDQVSELENDRLLVILDTPEKFSAIGGNKANIPAGSLAERENMKMIRRTKGPVVLCSGNPSVAAGAWMVLSQTGIKNLYILSDGNDEAMKHKFRPENASRPEF